MPDALATEHPILSETTITIAEAAARLPSIGGRPIPPKRVYEWADAGVKVGKDRVRLESCKLGGRRVTSVEALARFVAATSGESGPRLGPTPSETKKQSEIAFERVRAFFKRRGRSDLD